MTVSDVLKDFRVVFVLVSTLGLLLGAALYDLTDRVFGADTCHLIQNVDDNVLPGYGSPLAMYRTSHDELMRVLCDGQSATLVVGNGRDTQRIYKYAFERVDGSWERIELFGLHQSGDWILGRATALLPYRNVETQRIIAYTCEQDGVSWKCGCRDAACSEQLWQLQEFRQPAEQSATDAVLSLGSPSQATAYAGDTVSFRATGLSRLGNTLHFDPSAHETVTDTNTFASHGVKSLRPSDDSFVLKDVAGSQQGSTLTITVPELAPGGYRMWIENAAGELAMGTELRVLAREAATPHISSIEPQSGVYGTEVTLHGAGFSSTGNDVVLSYGVLRNVPSPDGTTLTFRIEPFKEEATVEALTSLRGQEFDIAINVANAGGVTNNPQTFTLGLD